jgi:hypothetical protein
MSNITTATTTVRETRLVSAGAWRGAARREKRRENKEKILAHDDGTAIATGPSVNDPHKDA